jgi:hypothetical protein
LERTTTDLLMNHKDLGYALFNPTYILVFDMVMGDKILCARPLNFVGRAKDHNLPFHSFIKITIKIIANRIPTNTAQAVTDATFDKIS